MKTSKVPTEADIKQDHPSISPAKTQENTNKHKNLQFHYADSHAYRVYTKGNTRNQAERRYATDNKGK